MTARGVKALLAVIFISIGSLFAFGVSGLISKLNADCTYETTGVVIDYVPDDENENFAPVYEFEMDGKKYTAHSAVYANKPTALGTENKVMVEPDDPTHISVPVEEQLMTKIFSIIGFVFIGIGVLVIFFPIGLLVKGKY